jgi:Pentapeptide repeats (8 copies)
MDDIKPKRILWYTRRDGVVRGPYPDKQIGRYILLGRIRDSDEVRPDDGDWAPLAHYPDLVPDLMKLPPTDENLQKLKMARLREDERRPRDRRDGGRAVGRERRGGVERRGPESEDMLRYRELRYQLSQTGRRTAGLYRYPLAIAAAVVFGLVLSYLLGAMQPEQLPPDCDASARPGVNWNGCNLAGLIARHASLVGAQMRNVRLDAADLSDAVLSGANLEYSSLNHGTLRNADLSRARLVGITARGADLRNAHFNHASLAYANLSDALLEGADLSGADLGNAIWVDHKPCLPGSVGACNRSR